MTIGLRKVRELSANELNQVAGGGTYGGTTTSPGWTQPKPTLPKPGH
jgi:bacteriocin-like protein